MATPTVDNEDIFKYVDEKISHSDELNRQILREIYEDQLQQIKLQSKKGYRDLEDEMEYVGNQELSDSGNESLVQDTAMMPMPENGRISLKIERD